MEAAVDVIDVNWRDVRSIAEELCEKSKDLRIGVQLARAVLATDGLVEFANIVSIIREWQDLFWQDLHPELEDASEGLPQPRISALSVLTTKDPNPEKQKNSTPGLLRTAALVSGKLGSVSLRDYQLANETGESANDESGDPEADGESKPAGRPGLGSIAAIFREESAVESSRATYAAVLSLLDNFVAISQTCAEHFGHSEGLNTDNITKILIELKAVLERFGDVVPVDNSESAEEVAESTSSIRSGGVPGEINTREDAIQALDRICAYFEKTEPSSPVPFMLRRAKKLVSKSFIEVLRELTPDAVDGAQHIIGTDKE